jgi:hypothetical protein
MRALALVLLLAAAGGHTALSPAAPTRGHPKLADLGFMAGCWRGASDGGGTIEEYYTAPAENLMLGLSRYLRDGRVTGYEFTTIAVRGDSDLVLTPRPSGQEAVDFRLTRVEPGRAVWSNPAHDFPRVISYGRVGTDSLAARIEGPGRDGTRSEEWRMGRTDCGK